MNTSENLKDLYPKIPDDYVAFICNWPDDIDDKFPYKVYKYPIPSVRIFKLATGFNLDDVIIIADDMAGYCIGYDTKIWKIIGIERSSIAPEVLYETFREFVSDNKK